VVLSGCGSEQTLTASTELTLAPCTYTLSPQDVTDGFVFGAPNQTGQVVLSQTTTASIVYQPKTARLEVATSTPNTNATISGPMLSGDKPLPFSSYVAPGKFTITPKQLELGNFRYGAEAVELDLIAGQTKQHTLNFAPITTAIDVAVSGVGTGDVEITGPNGYKRSVGQNVLIPFLTPGQYTVSPKQVMVGVVPYVGVAQTVMANVGETKAVGVAYTIAPPKFSLTMPQVAGFDGEVATTTWQVQNAGGAELQYAFKSNLSWLKVGTGGNLSAGQTADLKLEYTCPSVGEFPATVVATSNDPEAGNRVLEFMVSCKDNFDLKLAGWYVTQATQDLNRSVKLIEDRPAWLRVFVTANKARVNSPVVAVKAYQGTTLLGEQTLSGPNQAPVGSFDENSDSTNWKLKLPNAWVKDGVRLEVKLNPNNTIAERDPSNNTASDTLRVAKVEDMAIMFVPVRIFRADQAPISGHYPNPIFNPEALVTHFKKVMPVAKLSYEVWKGPDVLMLDLGSGSVGPVFIGYQVRGMSWANIAMRRARWEYEKQFTGDALVQARKKYWVAIVEGGSLLGHALGTASYDISGRNLTIVGGMSAEYVDGWGLPKLGLAHHQPPPFNGVWPPPSDVRVAWANMQYSFNLARQMVHHWTRSFTRVDPNAPDTPKYLIGYDPREVFDEVSYRFLKQVDRKLCEAGLTAQYSSNEISTDPNRPTPFMGIDATGFDVDTGLAVTTQTFPIPTLPDGSTGGNWTSMDRNHDFMSFCSPFWVSRPTYTWALDFRLTKESKGVDPTLNPEQPQ
jgi:hypothetical protein